MIILSFLFLLTATLYSSVGFGGGSTYLALLLIWDVPYLIFPVIALFCNIIVVSGNCINYIKAGNINFKILTPYLISSVPLAFIGGSLSVDKEIFEILLFLVLALAGVLLLMKFQSFDQKIEVYKKIPKMLSVLIGASIGFMSGIVGIGGGIFLSPILLLIRVDKAKNIATAASLFILINSLSGLCKFNCVFYHKSSMSTTAPQLMPWCLHIRRGLTFQRFFSTVTGQRFALFS